MVTQQKPVYNADMPADRFSTKLWVSHSSISDFLKCPRAYYLKNVYKDLKTGHKIQVVSPPLSLGMIVHEIIEALSSTPVEDRFNESLVTRFDQAWSKVTGEKGGFLDADTEHAYKERGKEMLRRVMNHPGPVAQKAVKIKEELPQFWLSEDEGIRLCGKIDWLEYLEDTDSVHIIDFKTSKGYEDPKSLQLPIYHLLVHYCQKRKVAKASYWYLGMSDDLEEKVLPDLLQAQEQVLDVARQMALARKLDRFKCPNGDEGCFACKPFEAVLRGDAKFVGVGGYNQDLYILTDESLASEEDSVIL